MNYVFAASSGSSFNGDISNWNTSSVTTMSYMFNSATSFNGNISNWDVSNVAIMNNMLSNSAFNGNISDWDTLSATSMRYMFSGSTDFDQDLGSWNVSGVTDMTGMFNAVTLSLENYDSLLIGWDNLSSLWDTVTFDAGDSQYCLGNDSKQNIIGNYSWDITDGGLNCSSFNNAPNNVTPILLSTDGLNLTTSDLNCSGVISDNDGDDMNVSVRWYKDSVLNLTISYNNNYANGTEFSAILDSGNASKGEDWNCSVRVYDGVDYSCWGNSSELEILNSLPTVSLVAASDWNSTTNRSLEFSWTGDDTDGDSMTYEINISEHLFAGAKFCNDDRSDNSLGSESYVPSGDLLCLHDNGYYYNWSVRANDGVGWGSWSSVRHLNVTAEVDVNLSVDDISFGSLGLGDIENTSDNSPGPFVLDNDGNVVINVSINSSQLWNTQSSDSSYYQFKVDNVTGEEGAFSWLLSIVSWFDMPITGEVIAVGELNYSDGDDSVETDIRLEVPSGEAPGVKSATIIFTGELAE